MKHSRIGPAAVAAFCLAGVGAAPVQAGVFTATADVSNSLPPNTDFDFTLPKYSGGEFIVSVRLTFAGQAGGTNSYPYLTDEGLTVHSGAGGVGRICP